MNRKERRAILSAGRNATVDRVVAIHEAGHVLGRILTAGRMGLSPLEAVTHVEVNATPQSAGSSTDGRANLFIQATTYGPMFSAKIGNALAPAMRGRNEILPDEVKAILATLNLPAEDISDWLRARSVISAAGPAAEARHLGQPFDDVAHTYECEADLSSFVVDGQIAGLEAEQISDEWVTGSDIAMTFISHPAVWQAVEAVATHLSKPGRYNGRRVAAVALTKLGDSWQSV